MGFVLSKFRRKKPSNKELLENVEKELRDIGRFQVDTELQQKRIIGRLLIFSSVVYLLGAAVFYFFSPTGLQWGQRLLYILPFILFPLLMWLIKRGISWYYDRKIVNNREKYQELKKEKEKLLEDVMDNETFKVAKEILEKYAPAHLLPKYLAEQQKAISMSPIPGTPIYRNTPQSMAFQDGIRRRQMNLAMGGPSSPQRALPQTPTMRPLYGPNQGQFMRQPANSFPRAIMPAPAPLAIGSTGKPISPLLGRQTTVPTNLPSYMLPLPPANPVIQNRGMGWMDKLVDYVVGDGASHRYALICRYCATHNGLATPEDFPYTGFRCVFCRQFNPPRQVRPAAPRLPINTVLFEELDQSSSTSREDTSSTSTLEENLSNSPNKESLETTSNFDYEEKSEPSKQLTSQDMQDEGNQFQTLEAEKEKDDVQEIQKNEPAIDSEQKQDILSDPLREAEDPPPPTEKNEMEFTENSASVKDLISECIEDITSKQVDECSSGFVMVDKSVEEIES